MSDDFWWDQRYEDALFAELGEEEYLRRMAKRDDAVEEQSR